jgi:hypothetical protein
MHEFIRDSLSPQKLRQMYVKAAFSTFVGFVAGSLVMMLTTYETLERKALKNLFGILPRKTVVVHRLPEWLEWSLTILVGYLVMELVRYMINNNKHLLLRGKSASSNPTDERKPTGSGRSDSATR